MSGEGADHTDDGAKELVVALDPPQLAIAVLIVLVLILWRRSRRRRTADA